MKEIDWKKNYPEGWEIFDAVISNSTWGSGPTGGPVWVIDSRYENVASLLPTHPWLLLLKVADISVHLWFEARIRNFITWHRLGNVLYLYSNALGGEINTRFNFWANACLLRKIEKACIGGEIWDFSQREKMSEEYLLKHYSHTSQSERN